MSADQIRFTKSQPGKIDLLTKTSSWLKLMAVIPKFGSDAFMIVTASVVVNLLALALPLALMQVYDRIIPNSSFITLGWLMLGVTTAIILETIVKIFRSFIGNWLSARLEHILNTEALNCFLTSRLDRFEQYKAGVHYEHFNAISIIKTYFSGQVLLSLIDIPFALLFLYLLYYIGGFLCYFTLLLILLYIVVVLVAKTAFEKHNRRQVDLTKEHLDFTLETLEGIHTIKALNMEDRLHRIFENIQARMASANLKVNKWKSVPNNISQFIIQLNMLGIIFLGADLVIRGTMTIGAMTACTMLATRGLQPVIKFAGFWLRFSEVTTAQKQVEKITALRTLSDQDQIPVIKDVDGTVTIENVTLKDRDDNYVINKFSTVIRAGQFVGVSGQNPTQTTALMFLLSGMYKPTTGKISIDEYVISTMDHSYFNGRVEYLGRKGRLFNGTLLDNISMFSKNKRQVALDSASLLGLDTFVADLPNGYETAVDQRSNESLPLGLIQRACFARALVTCPRVLIIDRTLNSLDNESHKLILEILEKMRGKCTVFLVSDYDDFPLTIDRLIDCTSKEVTVIPNN